MNDVNGGKAHLMAYWVDDTFDTWPEVFKAGTAAIGLYSRCGAYCARNSTDGHIPLEVATSYGTREWIAKLLEVGLWKIEESGYLDVYFLVSKDGTKLNPTREEVVKKRKQAADRQQRWRDGLAAKKKSTRDSRVSNASRNASHNASRDDSPSLPPSKEGREERAPATPGAAHAPPQHSPPAIAQPPDLTAVRAQLRDASLKRRVGAERTDALDELRRLVPDTDQPT